MQQVNEEHFAVFHITLNFIKGKAISVLDKSMTLVYFRQHKIYKTYVI
jgi:hypothetical protein